MSIRNQDSPYEVRKHGLVFTRLTQFPYALNKNGVARNVCKCPNCGRLMKLKILRFTALCYIPNLWCEVCSMIHYSEVGLEYIGSVTPVGKFKHTYEDALIYVLKEASTA